MAERLILVADTGAATVAVSEPHNGGIDLPRAALAGCFLAVFGFAATTGVASTSNR
jgi:hypothetical protein